MSSQNGSFSSTLTSDPAQRSILAVYQRAVNNKIKTRLAAEKLATHDPAAIKAAQDFISQDIFPKSVIETLIRRIRHDDPLQFSAWIGYMIDHYDEALALRAELKPQQTYVGMCGIISGLARYNGHENFTKEHRSLLLAAVYTFMANNDDSELTYNNVDRCVRLNNGELLEFIDEYAENAARIKQVMTSQRIVRPAEIEAALAGNTTTLVNGAL